jgi:hypothetical protein
MAGSRYPATPKLCIGVNCAAVFACFSDVVLGLADGDADADDDADELEDVDDDVEDEADGELPLCPLRLRTSGGFAPFCAAIADAADSAYVTSPPR